MPKSSLSAAERRDRAQRAANARWAGTPDRVGQTQPGRDGAALKRAANAIDPDRELPEVDRLRKTAEAHGIDVDALSARIDGELPEDTRLKMLRNAVAAELAGIRLAEARARKSEDAAAAIKRILDKAPPLDDATRQQIVNMLQASA